MSRRKLIFAKDGMRTSRMRLIGAWFLAQRIFARRDASFAKASFPVPRFYRFPRLQAANVSTPPATFPTPRRPSPDARSSHTNRPDANEWSHHGFRVPAPFEVR